MPRLFLFTRLGERGFPALRYFDFGATRRDLLSLSSRCIIANDSRDDLLRMPNKTLMTDHAFA